MHPPSQPFISCSFRKPRSRPTKEQIVLLIGFIPPVWLCLVALAISGHQHSDACAQEVTISPLCLQRRQWECKERDSTRRGPVSTSGKQLIPAPASPNEILQQKSKHQDPTVPTATKQTQTTSEVSTGGQGGEAGLGSGSLNLGKRKLCQAGDLCFRLCRKPPEDCLPSPGHTSILSLGCTRSSLCSCSTCKSETKVGQTFCLHTPVASSDSKAKLYIFAISADLCTTVYNKPDLKRPDHRLQHILQEWRSRGKEKCTVKAFRVLLIGQSKVFLSHRQSCQSHNAVCVWPQKVRHPCTQHALPVACREKSFLLAA